MQKTTRFFHSDKTKIHKISAKEIVSIPKSLGLAQTQIALGIQVTSQTFSNWESGRFEPGEYHLAILKRLRELAAEPKTKARALQVLRESAYTGDHYILLKGLFE